MIEKVHNIGSQTLGYGIVPKASSIFVLYVSKAFQNESSDVIVLHDVVMGYSKTSNPDCKSRMRNIL